MFGVGDESNKSNCGWEVEDGLKKALLEIITKFTLFQFNYRDIIV